jgi:hypothetical protein
MYSVMVRKQSIKHAGRAAIAEHQEGKRQVTRRTKRTASGKRSAKNDLEAVEKLNSLCAYAMKRFVSDERGPADLYLALSFVQGYPEMRARIVHRRKRNELRIMAHWMLYGTHEEATKVAMREAERVGLDSGPIWEFSHICRELSEDERWCQYTRASFPDCLGAARAELPDHYRSAIWEGEKTIWRLKARADLDPQLRAAASPQKETSYTVAALRDMTGLENTALNKYAKLAGVPTPPRGKRNHRYTSAQVRAILKTIIASCTESAVVAQCQIALTGL